MDTLSTLISRYLDKVNKSNALINDQSEESSTNKNKSESLSSLLSSISSKLPLPPSIPSPITAVQPIPITVNTLNKNNFRHSWVQRRFR
jgi:hypothetical protein